MTLYNISQLLRLFPRKPFYLTEYGYSTEDMPQFGTGVTQVQQASYLRKAYSMVARHRQIKVLLWFLVQDSSATFTGLQKTGGVRKLSWYAFGGGNSLSLTAPTRARAYKAFRLTGRLKNREGPLASKRLQLVSRLASQSDWRVVAKTSTLGDGTYSFGSVRQKQTRIYRVKWNGVTQSATRKVRTP